MKQIPAMHVADHTLLLFFAHGEADTGVMIEITDVTTNDLCSQALKVLAEVFRLTHEEEQALPPPPPSAPPMTPAEKADFDHGFNDYTDDVENSSTAP